MTKMQQVRGNGVTHSNERGIYFYFEIKLCCKKCRHQFKIDVR